jgi:DNA polymerase III delta subunit
MLYLFYGTDRNKALEKALGIISKKLSEKPDALVFKIDQENISSDVLIEMSGSQGMFEQKYIVHIKDVLQEEKTKPFLFQYLKEMKESDNIFIITEGKLLKPDFTKIEKHSEKVWAFEKEQKELKKENIFALTDYVINRDKKNLWIKFQTLKEIFSPEEIHGTLFWCFKNILIVSKTKSAGEAGLNPYVYSNSKKALTKYSKEELNEKFWQLTKILGDSRRGEGDLGILLEGWVLGV